jgi:hypothetical protein
VNIDNSAFRNQTAGELLPLDGERITPGKIAHAFPEENWLITFRDELDVIYCYTTFLSSGAKHFLNQCTERGSSTNAAR